MQAQKWIDKELLLTESAIKLWASTREPATTPIEHYRYAGWLLFKYIPYCKAAVAGNNLETTEPEPLYNNTAEDTTKVWQFWEDRIQPLELLISNLNDLSPAPKQFLGQKQK